MSGRTTPVRVTVPGRRARHLLLARGAIPYRELVHEIGQLVEPGRAYRIALKQRVNSTNYFERHVRVTSIRNPHHPSEEQTVRTGQHDAAREIIASLRRYGWATIDDDRIVRPTQRLIDETARLAEKLGRDPWLD